MAPGRLPASNRILGYQHHHRHPYQQCDITVVLATQETETGGTSPVPPSWKSPLGCSESPVSLAQSGPWQNWQEQWCSLDLIFNLSLLI